MIVDTNSPPDQTQNTQTCEYSHHDVFEVAAQGHNFVFYPDGDDRFRALIEVIEEAQTSLHIFYYMFQSDEAGTRIRDLLVDAAERGVEVSLIIDDFGTDAEDAFFDPIVEAGGKFLKFSSSWNVRFLIRNHQKFVIADSERVFTGGSNISDHYFASPQDNGWCDLGVRIEGSVVERFEAWFDCLCYWIEKDGSELRALRRVISKWEPEAKGEGDVALMVSGPSVRMYGWGKAMRDDLRQATRVDQVSAYFSPPLSILRILRRMARRGELRMITAGKSDIEASIAAARLLYKKLLRAGAKIAEFTPCKLHMKLSVIDDKSYFGSANMDRRSWRVNVELMVRVADQGLADRLREMIDEMEAGSTAITPEWYREHSTMWARMKWRGAYALATLDYWLSRNLNP